MSCDSEERDVRGRALDELDKAKAFLQEVGPEKLKDGEWFLALLAQVTKAYNRNARAEYFQKKYPGLPRDDIADALLSVATRYAAIVGAATGAAVTAGQMALPATGGASVAVLLGGIGAEMATLAAIQMRLVLDMAVIYDLDLDLDDPEDILMVFGYALGVAPVDLVGKSLHVPASALTKGAVKKYVSKGTLKSLQKFGNRVGVRILQKTIMKYAVPIASAAIGSSYNYVTTKSLGEIAKRHMKDRGKVTDELRAIVSRATAYDLVVPAAVLFAAHSDGKVEPKEKELYRAMLSRMSIEDHRPEDFERLVGDREGLLHAIGLIEDPDVAVDLIELIALMAVYDGVLAEEEKDWLISVGDRTGVPIDVEALEERAKEYEAVVREGIFSKASGTAGAVATRATGSADRARERLKGLTRKSRSLPLPPELESGGSEAPAT